VTAGRALAGLALVAVGAGTLLLGSSIDGSNRVRVEAAGGPVAAGARDPRDIRANNSPNLVRNGRDPRQLAVANRVDTPRYGCALHLSSDSGATWTESQVAVPAGDTGACFAPDVAFDAGGRLHLSFVTLGTMANSPQALWLTSSDDGGRTFGSATKVSGRYAFQPDLEADPDVPGRLYLAWLQAGELGLRSFATLANPVNVARSDDGGTTWGKPVRVSPPARARAVAPSLAVRQGGGLFLAYLELGDDVLDFGGAHEGRGGDPYAGRWQLVVARSTDGGRTWTETVAEAALVPAERIVVFTPPVPALAVRGNQVHVAVADARAGDPDVWLWSSTDSGSTWGAPRRVNDNPVGDGTTQNLPVLAVADSGRLDAVYYDRRADPGNERNEVSLQSSPGGKARFTPRQVLSGRSFDSRIGFGSENGLPDLGSRLGLASTRTEAVAVWTDTRAGTQASNKQDLARAMVVVTGPGLRAGWRRPLQVTGLAVALGGAAVAVGALRRRPEGRTPAR